MLESLFKNNFLNDLCLLAPVLCFFFRAHIPYAKPALVIGFVIEFTFFAARAHPSDPWLRLILVGAAGFPVYLLAMLHAWWANLESRPLMQRLLGNSLALPLFYGITPVMLIWLTDLRYYVYDAHLYAADSQFGVQAGFTMIRFWRSTYGLFLFSNFVYFELGTVMVFVQAWALIRPKDFRMSPLTYFVLLGLIGGVIYSWVPAVGPQFFFPEIFPWGPEPTALFPVPMHIASAAPRNNMPSLHAGWALGSALLARNLPRVWQACLWLFFVLTVCVFFLGSHYLIDAVFAIPLAVVVLNLGELRSVSRPLLPYSVCLLVGLALLDLGSLCLLRDFPQLWFGFPVLIPLMSAILILSSWACEWMQRRLQTQKD